MRILVLSNFYPPHYIGGYELGCHDVVEALKARGHVVKVLTSAYGIPRVTVEEDVHRELMESLGCGEQSTLLRLRRLFAQERQNTQAFTRLADSFRPHLLYCWNLTYVSLSAAFKAKEMGLPTCFYVFDNWLSRWETDPWYAFCNRKARKPWRDAARGILLSMLTRVGVTPIRGPLTLSRVQFASRYLSQLAYDSGKVAEKAQVIHWGILPDRFPFRGEHRNPSRLLYVGQVVEHKGVHTIIEALKQVVQEGENKDIRLTIAGGTIVPEYEQRIRNLVKTLELEDRVHFAGFLSREALPTVYRDHDILVFPSIWDEPFGITLLEAMSSGLAVVGTGTGGGAEIIEDNVNALLFPAGDAVSCAEQILKLVKDPVLCDELRQNGRRTVEGKFSFETTMDFIEESLANVANRE